MFIKENLLFEFKALSITDFWHCIKQNHRVSHVRPLFVSLRWKMWQQLYVPAQT